ncbi:putative UDP-N-acetylmuramoylalanyl-D-glutamate--2, 6-diaminopimelate ligase [Bifidobacterium actinocoloniiforme DSM 22766]|uniref:Putative UDP-N-acetylmuramoylalanyl-D-glutamate--2, 6-diaminopimelate ligase n=1 Tax=Bifidobacterium actinocoloniiforme DSM 22766 TaxID=1437605 RepID=A0A086YZR7_9BIFI|nr:hypothetical protein [Bifidobacterium actinocoloniiforme]KFI39767.1 putative UDP-N-acetylmuramoylalanyl-D-glutamate--2, 6-diaminopimelate ligase [Bifidobacterium actinocoloniiforme DSM 22766]
MSALSESIRQRMTLGYLRGHYGLELLPPAAEDVTVTSLADDLASVRPGSLYMPYLRPNEAETTAEGLPSDAGLGDDAQSGRETKQGRHAAPAGPSVQVGSQEQGGSPVQPTPTTADEAALVAQAELAGAYAVLLPTRSPGQETPSADIPLLIGDLAPDQLGRILSNAAGDPSASLAVFAMVGDDVYGQAADLADFLHTLGNPVGMIAASGSASLDRPLDLQGPLSMFDLQRALAICLEDGAAAVVIEADPATLQEDALRGVQIDVLAFPDDAGPSGGPVGALARFHDGRRGRASAAARRYGFSFGGSTQVARRGDESDEMARQALPGGDQAHLNQLSLNIAMTVAAGVKRSHIRSALEASQELS